jgi:hypothetical protein
MACMFDHRQVTFSAVTDRRNSASVQSRFRFSSYSVADRGLKLGLARHFDPTETRRTYPGLNCRRTSVFGPPSCRKRLMEEAAMEKMLLLVVILSILVITSKFGRTIPTAHS